mgnify:CR=1 FL=1
MLNHYRAIIWDMGGVLLHEVDQQPRWALAEKYNLDLEQLYRLVFSSESTRKATNGEISSDEHWHTIGATLGIPQEEMDDFQRVFWSGDSIDNQLISFIMKLKPDYKIGLLSNAWSDARQTFTEKFDIMRLFDQSIISAEIGLSKPDPAIYHAMLEMLGVSPSEAIFVDDLQENIDAANRLGITGVRFITADQAISEVKNHLRG